MAPETKVYIGLGSNLAQPRRQIKAALKALAALPGTTVLANSGYYASKPMGPQDQPDYINAVVLVKTRLAPVVLLDALQAIEQQQGRVRQQHWGARTLDLDILLYGDEQIKLPRLEVPHRGISQRDFVYLPLLKINPAVEIPGLGRLDALLADNNNTDSHYAASYLGSIEQI